jgi:triosephosphate isomerase
MRNFLIAGNWKMNRNAAETATFFNELSTGLNQVPEGVDVLICPVYTSLHSAVESSSKITGFKVGAQNMHFEDAGAFTGEVTADMIKETGAEFVIIGHSERRQYYAETDETVNKKTIKAIKKGLTPVICVGEHLSERKENKHFDVVKHQVVNAYQNIAAEDVSKTVIAYEPVWAIGTGETASNDQAQEMHRFIRKELQALYNADIANAVQILYGGSMKPENAKELLECADVDGGLIGGASLKPDSFLTMIQTAAKLKAGS